MDHLPFLKENPPLKGLAYRSPRRVLFKEAKKQEFHNGGEDEKRGKGGKPSHSEENGPLKGLGKTFSVLFAFAAAREPRGYITL